MATTRRVGDKVSVDHPKYPGVWTITKLAPVNATLQPEGGGRGLRVPHTMLTDPGAESPDSGPTVFYDPGELVRITGGRYVGLWVVIADKGDDKVNLAKLGGDGGRYLRVMRRGLVKVDVKDVLTEAQS